MDIDYNSLSKEEQIEFVSKYSYNIQYINNQCYEVQLAAVNKNGYSIGYIKNPYLEIQLISINKNGHYIEHINNPCYEVQLAAIQEKTNKLKQDFEIIKQFITYPDLLELLEIKMLVCEE